MGSNKKKSLIKCFVAKAKAFIKRKINFLLTKAFAFWPNKYPDKNKYTSRAN